MKTECIRVLQCVSDMNRAGIETMLMNFYRNIDKSKIQFDFLCNKAKPGDYDDEIRKLGGRIYVTPGLNPLKWFKYQKFMKKLFLEHPEYKIIHCQNEAMGFPALYAAKKAKIAVRIAHSHNTKTRFDLKWPIKILYKYLLRLVATDYVACGTDAGQYLFNKDFKVIRNSIDTTKFKYNEKMRKKIREELNLDGKFVIGHVGRFDPQKNHKFLINVFNRYQKNDDDAVLLLIGAGKLKNQIEQQVSKLKISNKVIFLGNIPNVYDYYNAMDLFILPSLHEGLPVVGVEAQSNGLTCLFSDKITREIALVDNTQFLELSEEKFSVAIAKSKCCTRNLDVDDSRVKDYDIHTGVKNLEKWYFSLSKRM